MRPVVDTVDFLLDLHSMHERCAPLAVSGPLEKGIALARKLGTPEWIISDEGHPEGQRMRDYADFGNPESPKTALLIECGQHWESSAADVARDATVRFLVLHSIVEAIDLPSGWHQLLPAASRVVRVTEPVVASSMDFRFAANYTGLETLSAVVARRPPLPRRAFVTCPRYRLFGANTPWKRVRLTRGFGTLPIGNGNMIASLRSLLRYQANPTSAIHPSFS